MQTEAYKVYQKAARYCSYQERTVQEVRDKLQALGITQKEKQDQLIQELQAANFLDEERYVAAFVRGKYLGKYWGKNKLLVALTHKGVAPALIQKGLAAIEDDAYRQCLRKVAHRKSQSLVDKDPRQRKHKLANYLLQKGYEPDLVQQTVQDVVET